jgi:hypothetical protein
MFWVHIKGISPFGATLNANFCEIYAEVITRPGCYPPGKYIS